MKPRNGLATGRTPSSAICLVLAALFASTTLSVFFNVLVAWHLHTMTA